MARMKPQCFACDTPAESEPAFTAYGWHSRVVGFMGVTIREIYCPPCFARYGWIRKIGPYVTPTVSTASPSPHAPVRVCRVARFNRFRELGE